MAVPVTLLKGDDEVVLRDAVQLLVDDLVGPEDRSLVVDEVEVGSATDDDAVTRSSRWWTPPRPRRSSPSPGGGRPGRRQAGAQRPGHRRWSTTSPTRCPAPARAGVAVGQGAQGPPRGRRPGPVASRSTPAPAGKVAEWVQQPPGRGEPEGRRRGPPAPGRPVWARSRAGCSACIDLLARTFGTGTKLGVAESSRSWARPAACRRGTSPTPSTAATARWPSSCSSA